MKQGLRVVGGADAPAGKRWRAWLRATVPWRRVALVVGTVVGFLGGLALLDWYRPGAAPFVITALLLVALIWSGRRGRVQTVEHIHRWEDRA